MSAPSKHSMLLIYARDAVSILQQALRHTVEGQACFYRVAAVELRLLLCDTTRRHDQVVSLALVKRLKLEISFQSLDPASIDLKLDLEDWLEQKMPEEGLTVRQFIRAVCDQDGGAHVDLRQPTRLPEWNTTAARIIQLSEVTLTALIPSLKQESLES